MRDWDWHIENVCMLLLLSHFSRVRLCATPRTAAHQAPPSMGFSRQQYWSRVPLPSTVVNYAIPILMNLKLYTFFGSYTQCCQPQFFAYKLFFTFRGCSLRYSVVKSLSQVLRFWVKFWDCRRWIPSMLFSKRIVLRYAPSILAVKSACLIALVLRLWWKKNYFVYL